jgi:hypothetical protein
MSDYTFMKSGFDMLQNDNQTDDGEDFQKNLMSILVAFGENAMKTASIYLKHHKDRNVILPEDIKRAMMLEMFLFKNRDNLSEHCVEVKNTLFSSVSTDSDEDIMFDEDTDEEVEFSENNCNCPVCHTINNMYEKWESLEPSTPIEEIMKYHIENI